MIRVAWVTDPGEAEYDMSLIRSDKLALSVWPIMVNQHVAREMLTLPNWEPVKASQTRDDVLDVLRRVSQASYDLIVFRTPMWIDHVVGWETFHSIFAGLPVVAWMSEQGPVRDRAMNLASKFTRVAVNNYLDLGVYRAAFPGMKLHYLPFGCVRYPELPQPVNARGPQYDLMADGGAHYACGCEGLTKRDSVDVMIRPWLERRRRLALWGSKDVLHGWPGVPGVTRQFRGDYGWDKTSLVYDSAKVYLGISWNWRVSGYGVKLARALAQGIAVVWHETPDMGADGLSSVAHCVSTAAECLEVGEWLLDHPGARGRGAHAGQEWALSHWSWEDNLIRLAHEVNA